MSIDRDVAEEHLTAAVASVLKRKLFFVAGQGKSGTTWLQLILDAHPNICCRGEGHLGDILLPGIDKSLDQYNQYLQHNNSLFREIPDYPPFDAEQRRILLRWAAGLMLARQCEGEMPAVIGERTPGNIVSIGLLNEIFPKSLFVHVIRDVRDIAVSLWFHGQRLDKGWVTREFGSLDELAVKLAGTWIQTIKASRQIALRLPGRYCEVTYESLHNDFDGSLETLLAFLGVDSTPEIVARCREASAFSAVSGGREPGDENRDSHFRKGVIGDWKVHLSKKTVARINEIAGPILAGFGYT